MTMESHMRLATIGYGDSTTDYMNGFHFGFKYARGYGLRSLLKAALQQPTMLSIASKPEAYQAGLVDAAIALVQGGDTND